MKTGHIRIFIDKKICFEYYELKKPKIRQPEKQLYYFNTKKKEEYKASKRLVEINNESYANCFNLDDNGNLDSFWVIIKNKKYIIQNNQFSKA